MFLQIMSKLEGWVLGIRKRLPELGTESGIAYGKIEFFLWAVGELGQVNGANLLFNVVTQGIEDSGQSLVALDFPGPLFVLVLHNWIIFVIKSC